MKKLLFLKTGIILVLVSVLFNACDNKDSNEPNSLPEPNAKGIRISCWVGANKTDVVLWINEYVIVDVYDEGSYRYGELENRSISYSPFSMDKVDQILSSWWDIPIEELKTEVNYMTIYNNRYNYKYFGFDHGFVYLFNRTSGTNY
ncbi:MAG: hypothetical protein J1F38_08060 [Muribaculaceae bacterium]|nr:hypothetical protein [Muribaculaceae bacterium]